MTEEKLLEIIAFYGNEKQKLKAIEEMSELTKAICKDDRENIIEELADVKIMIAQLMLIYNIDVEEVFKVMDAKVERTMNRIERQKL